MLNTRQPVATMSTCCSNSVYSLHLAVQRDMWNSCLDWLMTCCVEYWLNTFNMCVETKVVWWKPGHNRCLANRGMGGQNYTMTLISCTIQLVLFGVIRSRMYWCTENARYYDHKHQGKQNMHSRITEHGSRLVPHHW